jgi:hypothetical protein
MRSSCPAALRPAVERRVWIVDTGIDAGERPHQVAEVLLGDAWLG